MINEVKFYRLLDALDPRLNPIAIDPYATRSSNRTPAEILKGNLQNAEILMAVLDDSCDNLLRVKGRDVIQALQISRQAVAEAVTEAADECNEGKHDHLVLCGKAAMDALGMVYAHTSPSDIRNGIMKLASVSK